MEMEMEMDMLIFGAPKATLEMVFEALKASWELRFTSKRLLASHFEALEVSGHQEATRRAPRSSRGGPKRLPRRSLKVLWELFGVQEAPRNLPNPRSSIHSSFSEPPRAPPEVPKSRSIDPDDVLELPEGGTTTLDYRVGRARLGPRTRSRTRFFISFL